jgi:cell division septum initiation protein DivIVA
MFRRPQAALVPDPAGGSGRSPAAASPVPAHRPDIAGALDGLLGTAPCFRTAVRGYDRLQVDNYVAWAEAEIATARREADDLMVRYGQCAADLEISRRLLAQSPEGQELTFVSERVGRMLRMAADEAAEITAAAEAEADRIVAEARADADARLRKAHEIKEFAVATSDRMRAEAQAELERAREQADHYLRDATAQLRREQEAAAAAAAAQVAALQEEVTELRRRREQARDSLRRLTDQIGEALDALAGTRPAAPANFVVDRAPVAS